MAKSKRVKPMRPNLKAAAQAVRAEGRNGDTILAHINPQEAAMLKRAGGSGRTNPKTGLPSFEVEDGPGGTDRGAERTGDYNGSFGGGDPAPGGAGTLGNFGYSFGAPSSGISFNNSTAKTGAQIGSAFGLVGAGIGYGLGGLAGNVFSGTGYGVEDPGSGLGMAGRGSYGGGGNGYDGSDPGIYYTQGGAGGGTGGTPTTPTTPTDSWGRTDTNGDGVIDAADLINIQDPAKLATYIANQSWNNWIGDKAELDTLATTAGARGDLAYQRSLGVQDDLMDDHEAFAQYVNRLGTQSYRDEQRTRATADVQRGYDNAMGQNMRGLQRMGVTPGSGRYQMMMAGNAPGLAAQMAGAAMKAENLAYDNWGKGLQDLSTMKNKNFEAAKSWADFGLKAGQTGLGAKMDIAKLGNLNTATTGQVAGTAANAMYNNNRLAADQQRYEDESDPWNMLGGALLGGAGNAFGKWLFD